MKLSGLYSSLFCYTIFTNFPKKIWWWGGAQKRARVAFSDTNGATALSPDVSGTTLPATATMSDLTPGTEYTITITAYCGTVASGQPKTLTVTTCEYFNEIENTKFHLLSKTKMPAKHR